MATVRDICEQALRRIRVASTVDPVAAEDAAIARDVLNGMIAGWSAQGVEPFYTALTLSDTFSFFVPTDTAPAELISKLYYAGTWDANANSPILASGTGETGWFYKVSTSGSTTLDDVTSWTAGEYAIFSGVEWLKGESSARFNRAVVSLLALDLCDEYGKDPTATLVASARTGWTMIQAAYLKAPTKVMDSAIMRTYVRSITEGVEENVAGSSGGPDTDVYLVED